MHYSEQQKCKYPYKSKADSPIQLYCGNICSQVVLVFGYDALSMHVCKVPLIIVIFKIVETFQIMEQNNTIIQIIYKNSSCARYLLGMH